MPKLKALGPLQNISLSFTLTQYAGLVALARLRERTIAWLVRDAVDRYLATELPTNGDEAAEGVA